MDHPTDSRALPALYQIATLVGQSDEPRDVLRQILQTIIDAVGGVSGDVSLVNPDSKQLEVELANGPNGPSDEDLSMRLGQGITGWVAFHGKPQLVPDVTQDPRYVELREHVRTEIAAPMLGPNGQVMGVINIDGDRAGAFNAPDLDLLVRLTAEATIVINRHWELRNLRGKARQLESLISIGQSLVTQLEPEKLFNSIASDARQITGFRACGLFTYEPDAQTVRLVAYDGPTPDILPQAALPLDSCLVSSSIHTRKAIEYANVQSPEFGDIIDLPREPVYDPCSPHH